MKSPEVLIIEGHVQGLSNLRAVSALGAHAWVIDKKKCIASHSKHCQHFAICPDFNTPAFIDFLVDFAEKHKIKNCLILPSNDHIVINIANNKSRLTPYYLLPGYDAQVIDTICDKGKLLNVAESVHVPIPNTAFFHRHEEATATTLSFPVLTKGRYGLTFYKKVGKKALIAFDKKDLTGDLQHIEKALPLSETFTQEVIPSSLQNKTLSYAAFAVDGEIKAYWMGEKLREHPITFGTATLAISVHQEVCHNQSVRLLKALNYTGICEIEYLLDLRDNQYKLIEINPRTWLWVGLARECGVDFAGMLLKHVQGKPTEHSFGYETGVMWYNPFTDPVYSLIAIFKGKLSPLTYLKTLFHPRKTNAFFAKGDLKPGFAYFFNLFSFLKHR
jgi:D-aspartate ligase